MKANALLVILASLIGVAITGSGIYRTDTSATYVFQDSLAPMTPWPSGYKGIEDAMLAGGTAQSKRNFGLSELFRVGVSSGAGGIHRAIMRHNPFYIIDSTNVASWDSVVITFTNDTTPVNDPKVDTLYAFGVVNTKWLEGTGTGQTADTIGVNGLCYNSQTPTGTADSTWKAFRAGKADSTRFTGIQTVRADSFPLVVSYDALFNGGNLSTATVDRAPFPAAIKLCNNVLTPSGTAWTWNVTSACLWQLKRNQPMNLLFSIRCDTTGVKATQSGATQDSVSGQKLDMRSSDYASAPTTRPIITYYVHLKRAPLVIGSAGVR